MGKKTILLVEDDGVINALLKEVLERKYNVLAASKFSEALRLFTHTIDLAIIDYILPDLDGFKVLKALREAKPGLPTVMITAYSTEDLAIRSVDMELAAYIKKPFSPDFLMWKLSRIFEGKNGDGCPVCHEHPENREMLIMAYIGNYIEKHFMDEITLDKLAGMAGMNSNKFSSAFKEHFGLNFKPYLNTVRLRNAAELLRKNPDLTVLEIAYSVGYKSIDHFDRKFRKAYGTSPRQYRREIASPAVATSAQ